MWLMPEAEFISCPPRIEHSVSVETRVADGVPDQLGPLVAAVLDLGRDVRFLPLSRGASDDPRGRGVGAEGAVLTVGLDGPQLATPGGSDKPVLVVIMGVVQVVPSLLAIDGAVVEHELRLLVDSEAGVLGVAGGLREVGGGMRGPRTEYDVRRALGIMVRLEKPPPELKERWALNVGLMERLAW
eukprot:scaffold250351_cov31-Tisochrysis_lutea.AAC.2